jgi:fumarate reductase subunit D
MSANRLTRSHRSHFGWWAALLHRLSGLAIALFLPLHFLALGLALDSASLDGFLDWTRAPLVRATEAILVAALVVHLIGGARILLREVWPW